MYRNEELLITIFLAFFGGFTRLLYGIVEKNDTRVPPTIVIISHMIISLFVGVLAWLITHHYRLPFSLEAPIVLLSGFLGFDALTVIHVKAIKRLRKKLDEDSHSDNGPHSD